MKRHHITSLLLATLLFASCATIKRQTAKIELEVEPNLTIMQSTDLFTGEYYVPSITESALPLTPAECPSMHFDSVAKRVAGYNGCNHYFCNYELKDDKGITFTQPGATMMACPNMDIETAFMQALESVRTYEATINGMVLKNEDGDIVLTLTRKSEE